MLKVNVKKVKKLKIQRRYRNWSTHSRSFAYWCVLPGTERLAVLYQGVNETVSVYFQGVN
jgi:hypothetical protein